MDLLKILLTSSRFPRAIHLSPKNRYLNNSKDLKLTKKARKEF